MQLKSILRNTLLLFTVMLPAYAEVHDSMFKVKTEQFVNIFFREGKNNMEYTLMNHDIKRFVKQDFGKLCEALLYSGVFFMAWPDIITKNDQLFIIKCSNISFMDGNILKLIQDPVIYINKKDGIIIRITSSNQIDINCSADDIKTIQTAKKKFLNNMLDPDMNNILENSRSEILTQTSLERRIEDQKVIWIHRFTHVQPF